MTRTPIAVIGGLIGFFFYIAAVLAVSDSVVKLHWIIQAVFFVVTGFVWVFPVRWLMLWAAGKR